MPRDHIVPRFLLARWADPTTGKIVVWDRRSGRESTEIDPVNHATVEDFNVDQRPDGHVDAWLESEFFAGLEDKSAGALNQLEQVQPPGGHIRRLAGQGMKPFHLLPGRRTAALAMFIGAQMVRSPLWRGAIDGATLANFEASTKSRIEAEIEAAGDPDEIARLKELLGVRCVGVLDKATQIQLSGHLAYRIGEVLYCRFLWSVHRFPSPVLVLGDEPVILSLPSGPSPFGSLANLALKREVLSIHRGLRTLVEDVLEIVASARWIVMPFGPRHALVLNAIDSLCLPGRYDRPAEDAKIHNTLVGLASRSWAVWQPGMNPEVFDRGELKKQIEWFRGKERDLCRRLAAL
jgi:Protein of unknown function (DUF4238)